jgi:hypothetical protein
MQDSDFPRQVREKGVDMKWRDFKDGAPELAALGTAILNRKIAFLATLKKNGGPRLHPIRPIIGSGHCFVFINETSPKKDDLLRDGRYALHGSVTETNGLSPEIMISGRAVLVEDADTRTLSEDILGETVPNRYALFEFLIDSVLVTEYSKARLPVRHRWISD